MRRRDLRIINLDDKPLFTTMSRARLHLVRGWNRAALGCRDRSRNRSLHVVLLQRYRASRPCIHPDDCRRSQADADVSGEAPKPDMHSPAVTRAEADVPATQGLAQAAIPEPSASAAKESRTSAQEEGPPRSSFGAGCRAGLCRGAPVRSPTCTLRRLVSQCA